MALSTNNYSRYGRLGRINHTSSFRKPAFGRNRYNRYNRSASKYPKFNMSLLVQKSNGHATTEDSYQAIHSFSGFAINDTLRQNIVSRGYTVPTPIQDQAIPQLLKGRDVVGIANTGTGKTAAFLIPIINKIASVGSEKALIIAPTRELAVQILEECRAFARGMRIVPLLCIGGVGIYQQKQALRRHPHIVIGTPGRLKDLKNQGCLNLSNYNTIVLDEVDRMLDMGFIPDIKFLISHLPKVRQSLFFSATVPAEVSTVMNAFLNNPVRISVKTRETPLNVDQDIVKINGREKLDVLNSLLRQEGFEKVLVFGRTKWGIEKLARQLDQRGLRVASIHGNKNQNQRQRALELFKFNKVSVLLATDIASRGLDIDNVTHVINYDLPETYDEYVHRIGRTGRADKKGTALSFID